MRLFKNFKTKRQLREENERLKFELWMQKPMRFVEREAEKVCSCMEITDTADKVPMEYIKRQIAHNLVDELEPFIEWDIEDNSDQHRYGKAVRGSLYLAKRK